MKSAGIDEAVLREYVQRTGKRVRGLDVSAAPQPETKAKREPRPQTQLVRQAQRDTRNRTEKAFENEVLYFRKLRGELIDYYPHESIRLTLSNGVCFTPDYPAIEINPAGGTRTVFYECKGERRGNRVTVREDAAIKLKMAPQEFPHYRFVLVWKCPVTGEWREQELKD